MSKELSVEEIEKWWASRKSERPTCESIERMKADGYRRFYSGEAIDGVKLVVEAWFLSSLDAAVSRGEGDEHPSPEVYFTMLQPWRMRNTFRGLHLMDQDVLVSLYGLPKNGTLKGTHIWTAQGVA